MIAYLGPDISTHIEWMLADNNTVAYVEYCCAHSSGPHEQDEGVDLWLPEEYRDRIPSNAQVPRPLKRVRPLQLDYG